MTGLQERRAQPQLAYGLDLVYKVVSVFSVISVEVISERRRRKLLQAIAKPVGRRKAVAHPEPRQGRRYFLEGSYIPTRARPSRSPLTKDGAALKL